MKHQAFPKIFFRAGSSVKIIINRNFAAYFLNINTNEQTTTTTPIPHPTHRRNRPPWLPHLIIYIIYTDAIGVQNELFSAAN
jgi:hypothetical protein